MTDLNNEIKCFDHQLLVKSKNESKKIFLLPKQIIGVLIIEAMSVMNQINIHRRGGFLFEG